MFRVVASLQLSEMDRFKIPIFSRFLLLSFIASTTQVATMMAANHQDQRQSEPPTLEHCKDLIDSALPKLVQFSYSAFGMGRLHFGCGVIVSPEGHVVVSGPVAAVLSNRSHDLRLSDGRKVRGEALGWSSEFGFGVLKITDPGEWPHVKVSEQIRAGEVCLALGYNRNHDGLKDFKNSRPES